MTAPRPRILVLRGGPDAERDVSLDSGAAVARALRASGDFDVRDEVIDRLDAPALAALAPPAGTDAIFPVLHGTWGEGGGLQALLERHGVPFVGAGARAAAVAMDKLATKALVAAAGVATPPACGLEPADRCAVAPPLVLKPVDDGSSVDLAICPDAPAVAAARARLHARRGRLMAERYVRGREITAGVLDGVVLPLIEIVPAVAFYDYAAKYERDDTRYHVDPPLPPPWAERCREGARAAWRAVGARDLARVDFMVDAEGPWFLEINTMPGFTDHSLLPMAASVIGIAMPELCARLARCALARGPGKVDEPRGERPMVGADERTG